MIINKKEKDPIPMDYSENTVRILKEMEDMNVPVGAVYLSERMKIPQASIGRILFQLEQRQFVKKVGSKGRIVTELGREYLKEYDQQRARMKTVNQLANVHSGGFSKQKLLEVLDVRMLLETRSAELASMNYTNTDKDSLEKRLLEWKLALYEGRLGSEEDLNLHLYIAEMSKNTTLYFMCKLLLTEDNIYADFSANTEKLTTIQTEQHEEIVRAIISKKPAQAKELMHQHLKTIYNDIQKSTL